jgi:hypothetical protein
MNDYKEFNQFENLKYLDNFEKYEIYLGFDMFKKYRKQDLSHYLNDINNEIEQIRIYLNDK